MISVIPSVTNSDLQGFLALVAFSADPKSCAKRVLELKALSSELQDKSDSLAISKQEFEASKLDVDTLKSNLEGRIKAVANTQADLDVKLKAALVKGQEYDSNLRTLTAQHALKLKDLETRENLVFNRENKIQNRQDDVDQKLTEVNNLKKELANKLAQFKALAN